MKYFVVLKMMQEVLILNNQGKEELKLLSGVDGYLPVFKNREEAEKEAGETYEIIILKHEKEIKEIV